MNAIQAVVFAIGTLALADAAVLSLVPARRRDRMNYGGTAAYAIHIAVVASVGLLFVLAATHVIPLARVPAPLISLGVLDITVGLVARRRQRPAG